MRKPTLAASLAALVSLASLAAAPAVPPRRPLELRLAAGPFRPADPPSPPPAWYEAAAHPLSANGRRYLVAITASSLTSGQRSQIEAAGGELLDYLPLHGYRLRLAPAAEPWLRSLPFVLWLGELPRHVKVHPDLAASAGRPADRTKLRVIVEQGEPAARVLELLRGTEALAHPSGKDGAWRIEAEVAAGRLAAILSRLAGLPEVEAVEPARPLRPLNQDAVWVHQSFVGPSPQQTPIFDHGIFGCGQTLAFADSGQDHDLCYFRDAGGPPPIVLCAAAPCPAGSPNLAKRKDILYYNWSGTPTGDDDFCPGLFGASGHGTHTSGSLAGDQLPYADCAGFTTPGRSGGDGQAPGAKLVVQEMGDGLEYLNSRGGTIWNLASVAYQNGARIHSNSWGGACHDAFGSCIPGCTLPYDSFARDADLAMWTYPDLLLVFSAGNAGEFCPAPNSVSSPAIAKNSIAAGSVGHGAAAGTTSSFSSPGPVFDGRLKPTLAAQGEAVVSAGSDANPASLNCDSCSLDGTSMSAPTTAGLAALAREYYEAGFLAAGFRNSAAGFTPSAALLKATLIDGAVALGASAPSPDFEAGYGRILLDATLPFAGSPFQLRVDDHREGIVTGSVVSHAYDVSGGTPLRATLVWTDPPAALNAGVARVNELKLEVIDPSGNVWFQRLDPITGAPIATSSAADPHDAVNVEERLVFNAPAAGRWVVRVRGIDVAWGPQPFALVVRGALADCAAPAAPGPLTVGTPADHQVQLSWAAVPGAVAYNVYRTLGACADGPWIQVAAGVGGTSQLDAGVSGGATYRYHVTAASDATGDCESPRSPCASVVPTGDCTLAPEFGGATLAASAGQSGCAIDLMWEAASPYCVGEVRYSIYRGTTDGFTPAPANRIARCVEGTSYQDAADLVSGTTYYYVVRAEDGTFGHAGPCHGGNEDGNGMQVTAAPAGPAALGTWSDDAGDTGTAKFVAAAPWTIDPGGGNSGAKVYRGASSDTACADLTSPELTVGSPGLGPQLSFSTIHDLEYDPFGFFGAEGSLGQVEIAAGPSFANWTRVPLTPDYPTPVEFPLNNCPSTQNIDYYFSDTDLTYSTYTASLANWGGQDVRVRFHLSGDILYPGGNWWIDDVSITQAITPGSCSTLTPGPPPIPDGASVPGQPLAVALSGSDLLLTWDAASCPAAEVNVYWGSLGSYGAFTGGVCGLPPTGTAIVSPPDNAWLVVVATDGVSVDGSYSRDAAGNERSYAGSGAVCPAITQHVTTGGCP